MKLINKCNFNKGERINGYYRYGRGKRICILNHLEYLAKYNIIKACNVKIKQ